MPKFSIIVPVYNVEEYIRECLDSIVTQKFLDYEVIIVNDASPDRSIDICNEYAEKYDTRFIVVNKEKNEGLYQARTTGLDRARGLYIIHLDSDDRLSEDALETIDRYTSSYPDVISYGFSIINQDSKIVSSKLLYENDKWFSPDNLKEWYNHIFHEHINSLWSKTYKRSLYKKSVENRRINQGEDIFRTLEIEPISDGVYISKPLYEYRYNPKSITRTFDVSKTEIWTELNEKLFTFMQKAQIDTKENYEYLKRKRVFTALYSIVMVCSSTVNREQVVSDITKLYSNKDVIYSLKKKIITRSILGSIELFLLRHRFIDILIKMYSCSMIKNATIKSLRRYYEE